MEAYLRACEAAFTPESVQSSLHGLILAVLVKALRQYGIYSKPNYAVAANYYLKKLVEHNLRIRTAKESWSAEELQYFLAEVCNCMVWFCLSNAESILQITSLSEDDPSNNLLIDNIVSQLNVLLPEVLARIEDGNTRVIYLLKYRQPLPANHYALLVGDHVHHLTNVGIFGGGKYHSFKLVSLRNIREVKQLGTTKRLDDEIAIILEANSSSYQLFFRNCQTFAKEVMDKIADTQDDIVDLELSIFSSTQRALLATAGFSCIAVFVVAIAALWWKLFEPASW